MNALRTFAVAALACAFVAGIASATAHAADAPAATAAARTLHPFDAASPAAIRARHAGKPFILAFWSITCAPCLEDMATWRALKRRHPELPIVLVATDGPAQRARLLQTLARYDVAGVDAWNFADEFAERVRFAVDPRWRGELPRTYYYDARQQHEVTAGKVDPAAAEAWYARQHPRQPNGESR